MLNKEILVILGPTASGKSSLGVRLARKFKGEIISADSRQVYKGLNVGSGKLTKPEMRGIKHHLLNVADPKQRFSVSDFLILTNAAIAEIVKNKKLPIVVGGTGFYIDALAGTAGFPDVPPNKLLRDKLHKLDKEKLFSMLKEKDLRRAKSVDSNNKVRLIRALEIVSALGKVPPVKHRVFDKNFIYIGLLPNDLDKRIERRVKKMFKQGLLREIQKLKRMGIINKRLKELGFEYWNPTEGKLVRDTKRFAKRQLTWFKRNKGIKWFKPEQTKEIEKYVRSMLR